MEDWLPRGVFGKHPHRGIETVTYVVEGRIDHYDNQGHEGTILPGDVQWMTAGRGLMHNEIPAEGDYRVQPCVPNGPFRKSGLVYETPRGEELSERLSSVLEVVYLIFNEGYTAARGEDWLRPQLCNEALRMGRVLTSIAPHEPEAYGLLALMELNASRAAARTDPGGEPILLMDQNRARWDQLQIRRGMEALGRARELGGAGGAYALQAAIIACHALARTAGDTDWSRISELYAELVAVVPSPVIELNRAVAVGIAEGSAAALAIVNRLAREPALQGYHLLPSVRGDAPREEPARGESRARYPRAESQL